MEGGWFDSIGQNIQNTILPIPQKAKVINLDWIVAVKVNYKNNAVP